MRVLRRGGGQYAASRMWSRSAADTLSCYLQQQCQTGRSKLSEKRQAADDV